MDRHLLCFVFVSFAFVLAAADVYKDKCKLPHVLNGYADPYQDYAPINAKVYFYCEDGYEMHGINSLHCTPKGFDYPPPVCRPKKPGKKCPRQLQYLEYGFIDAADQDFYHPGQGVWYICNKGYVLIGKQDVYCLDNGEWDHPPPRCEPSEFPCKRRDPPVYGSQHPDLPSYHPGVTVRYECRPPYVLKGSEEAFCLPNGKWSYKVPICELPTCRDIVKPDNGYFEVQGGGKLVPGNMVFFFCFDHYRLVGSRKITCLDNGKWSDDEPKCVPIKCDPLEEPENGSLKPKKPFYKVGDRVKFDCDDHFDLIGSDESVCLDNGHFSHPPPKCRPQRCPRPVLDNGKFSEDRPSYPVGEYVFFMCNPGYVLKGNEMVICTKSGDWSDEFPICKPIQCDRPFFENGYLLEDKESYDFEEVVKFICDPGFTLVGLQKLECTSTGDWSDEFPICKPIQCKRPFFKNGKLIEDKNFYKVEETVKFVCDPGFELDGKMVLECLKTGEWSHKFPICVPVKCDRPTIDNGYFEEVKDEYHVDDEVHFFCDDGFTLEGHKYLTCLSSGKWSQSFPVCIPVVCKRPKFLNGELTPSQNYYDVNQMVFFKCDPGFRLVGAKKSTCQSNGEFHPEVPTCEAIKCDRPDFDPKKGFLKDDKPLYHIHDVVFFFCKPGYKLVGAQSLKCLDDGGWSGEFPVCKPVMCTQPELENGEFDPIQDMYDVGQNVSFKCDKGFVLKGAETIKCLKTAKWSDKFPICFPVICEVPFIDNGSFEEVKDHYFFGDMVTFSCDFNFYLDGVEKITCQADGTWSDPFPTCNRFTCEKPEINNGGFQPERDEYVLNDEVKFFCDDGFSLVGEKKITCEDMGKWSDDFPICKENTCERPFIENGSFEDDTQEVYRVGDMVRFKCDEGFRLKGEKKLTCESDGQWSDPFPTCKRVTCPRPDVAEGVSFVPNRGSYLVGQKVMFMCVMGTTLVGAEKAECLPTGEWSEEFPTCEENMCDKPFIKNGKFSPEKPSYPVSAKVTFECFRGFVLKGVEEIHCRKDGSWSADFPTCERVTCPKPSIEDGKFSPVQKVYYYRDVVTFTCDDGFKLSGRPTIKCLETGKWSDRFPTCKENMCDPPKKNPNIISILPSQNTYDIGDVVTFKCKQGFVLVGSETSECQSDETWSPVEPTCKKVVQCHAPTKPKFSVMTPYKRIFNVGETITYKCRRGFVLVGKAVITCQDDGKFDRKPPVCKRPEVKCRKPYIPRYSIITPVKDYYKLGEKIYFSCKKPYVLDGAKYATCQAYGRFSPRTPSCKAPISNSCKKRSCNDRWDRRQPCQCNRYCKYVKGSCCPDYKETCLAH